MESLTRIKTVALLIFFLLLGFSIMPDWRGVFSVSAQVVDVPAPLVSLKTVTVPEPPNLGEFVKDRAAAIALGKALFWDMQTGSDGMQSCATCHFHAGADSRSKNQLNPGGVVGFEKGGPNYQLAAADYPFHKLTDPNDRLSPLAATDVNEVAGSQGVLKTKFFDIAIGSAKDKMSAVFDNVFNVNGTNVRQTTGRNSPSVINAVFNHRNFWDGRAQNEFNGVNPFGSRDANAFVLEAPTLTTLNQVKISLINSSLASQAVGPPNNQVEMSADGRDFRKLGKKMLALNPLALQTVAVDDSVLGTRSNSPSKGLKLTNTYKSLIMTAFQPKWWKSNMTITPDPVTGNLTFTPTGTTPLTTNQYTLMESNFSLFWGLAIQMYEATLRSDDTPFDRYAEGNAAAMTEQQKQGFFLFKGKASCSLCHAGAELTGASVQNASSRRMERMITGDNLQSVYDNGFYNIGVRPTAEDLGVGGKDPFNKPLSITRLEMQNLIDDPNRVIAVSPDPLADDQDPLLKLGERIGVDGSFKTPSLRNVELTAPYFHNGGQATLSQVVDFYNRGGDFHETNLVNLDLNVTRLELTVAEKAALVAFLKALTDDRVRYLRAPFDHPSLQIPDGFDSNNPTLPLFRQIPAVGRNGVVTPLSNFLGLR